MFEPCYSFGHVDKKRRANYDDDDFNLHVLLENELGVTISANSDPMNEIDELVMMMFA